ncbi:MAG: L-tyrosine/L-tryptophan isonitrile synthase family protein [Alphaproteobacteria bacterium]|nr:L-tyrosine/L-tryptophan isonitrile synthase family protein [Alphaproteobacteria bacterium]
MRDAADIAVAVAEAFDRLLRLPLAEGDRFEAEGRAALVAQLTPRIAAGRPLPFVLPGFGFKNPNRRKTLGPLPDLGEQRALERLSGFCEAVAEVYAPGAALTIVSGGWVWSFPLGVSVETVTAYWSTLQQMGSRLEGLRFASLDQLWGCTPQEALGHALAWSDPSQMHEMEAALAAPEAGDLRRVLARFMRLSGEDTGLLPEGDRRYLCMRGMLQHRGFTAELARLFPEHVRLSVHLSANAGPKYSVRLLESAREGLLPYHGAILVDGEVERAMHRCEAEALGAVLVEREGRPWCLRR